MLELEAAVVAAAAMSKEIFRILLDRDTGLTSGNELCYAGLVAQFWLT